MSHLILEHSFSLYTILGHSGLEHPSCTVRIEKHLTQMPTSLTIIISGSLPLKGSVYAL